MFQKGLALAQKYDKFTRFLFGGIFITILQVLLLYVFTGLFSAWYLLSSQLAFIIAFIVSFFIYRGWVFPASIKSAHHQFILYTVLTIINFLMNGFGMYLFVDLFGLWYIWSQIIVKILISISSYIFYNVLIFNS